MAARPSKLLAVLLAVAGRFRPTSALQAQAHRGVDARPPEEVYTTYFHLHIPKCGGVSFRTDLESQLPKTSVVISKEECYDDIGPIVRGLTLLRQPRAHVLSQYMHCTTSPDGATARAHMPESFDAWVTQWAALRERNETKAFCCYDPVDMQSYILGCPANSMVDESFGIAVMRKPRLWAEVDIELALRNLQSLWFVGVVEAYQESLCVLLAKASGVLPAYCDCEDPAAWGAAPHTSEDHGSAAHGAVEVSAPTLAAVDRLTAGDRILYAAGVQRFLADLREVERAHGVRVLCRELSAEPQATLFGRDARPRASAELASVNFGQCDEVWGL